MRWQFDEQKFLARYWQREPLLIKGALPDFQNPLSPEELAGLALEADVQSRIVSVQRDAWRLEHGPFDATDFQRSDLWTLLVQQVDRLLPQVEALKEAVAFLPSWRFDDVMVSYAVDGGSVGPHFDRYDVFLLQGQGQRLWKLGDFCDESTPRLEHDALHLLKAFDTRQEYLLEPGDVLYVPPGLAHWGIARGDCMTYSLGFRAPNINALLARLADQALALMDPQLLLEDRDAGAAGRPGEITQQQVDNARRALLNALEALDDGSWLAEVVSDPDVDLRSSGPLLPGPVRLLPGAQLVWIDRGSHVAVYCRGNSVDLPSATIPLLEALCAGQSMILAMDSEEKEAMFEFLRNADALCNDDI